MTFNEIVEEIQDRLNLSSYDSEERIGKFVNKRYRWITTSLGLITTRRSVEELAIDPAVSTDLPDYNVGMEKILKVQLLTDDASPKLLKEVFYEEISDLNTARSNPVMWAVNTVDDQTTTITLDAYPTTTFTLRFIGYVNIINMEDDDVPQFPESFHDILVEGAMSDELRKMEKADLSMAAEQRFKERLSDLKMFINKSIYMDIFQGKNKPQNWYSTGMGRNTIWE